MRKAFANSAFKIAIAPSLVLMLHIVATVGGYYETFWWFDIPLHLAGGVAIAISGYFFLEDFYGRQKFHIQFKPLQILILISFVALGAVLWEFMEFSFDRIFHSLMQPDLPDTIKDMAMGLTGGGITTLLLMIKKK